MLLTRFCHSLPCVTYSIPFPLLFIGSHMNISSNGNAVDNMNNSRDSNMSSVINNNNSFNSGSNMINNSIPLQTLIPPNNNHQSDGKEIKGSVNQNNGNWFVLHNTILSFLLSRV